jgi:hypothetical protein
MVKKIVFSRLSNEQHYEFLLEVQGLLNAFPEVKGLVSLLFTIFSTLLNLEKKLLDAARASYFTHQIMEADRRVDLDLVGIKAAIHAALHHIDPAIVEAARQLNFRLKDFGDIIHKSYEAESAAVQVLLGEFADTFATQVELVGITPWVDDLTVAEQAFNALYAQRNTELADRPKERMRDVQRDIQAEYGKMVTCIESDVIGNGEAKCGEFVRQLNEQIKYFNEHSHHTVKHDLTHAAVDSIADQPFAGKAITPIPVVRYTDSKGAVVELIFAKDFTLTYKDNDRVGTAEAVIHGKGAYKGQKAETFNIV